MPNLEVKIGNIPLIYSETFNAILIYILNEDGNMDLQGILYSGSDK